MQEDGLGGLESARPHWCTKSLNMENLIRRKSRWGKKPFPCTWDTVVFLMCEPSIDNEDLMKRLQPNYAQWARKWCIFLAKAPYRWILSEATRHLYARSPAPRSTESLKILPIRQARRPVQDELSNRFVGMLCSQALPLSIFLSLSLSLSTTNPSEGITTCKLVNLVASF